MGCVLSCFSRVRLFAALWTVAHQAPLSMRFSRQAYWSGLPCPSPGDLPNPETELASPALAGGFFAPELSGKPQSLHIGPCLSTLPPLSEDCTEMARKQPCPQYFTVEVESEHFLFRKTVWYQKVQVSSKEGLEGI